MGTADYRDRRELREMTRQVQREQAVALERQEQIRALLLDTRDAVDRITIDVIRHQEEPPAIATEAAKADLPVEKVKTVIRCTAEDLGRATVAAAEGRTTGRPGEGAAVLMHSIEGLGSPEQFRAIRKSIADKIVEVAAHQVHERLPDLSEDSLKVLMKVAIQRLRSALAEAETPKPTEAQR